MAAMGFREEWPGNFSRVSFLRSTTTATREGSAHGSVDRGMTTYHLAVPLVHLNGTSSETLLRQNEVAVGALEQALQSLCRAAPNARDFYPRPEGFEPARREHDARVAKLREVLDELIAIGESVQAQIDARVRR